MWALGITVLVGIWLLASPGLIGNGGAARVNNLIVGTCMAAFATVAISECMRPVRWANCALGIWLIIAPFALNYSVEGTSSSMAAGAVSTLLALVRGRVTERFGGGWSALWRKAES